MKWLNRIFLLFSVTCVMGTAKTFLFLGDSISSGYGVPMKSSFFSILKNKFNTEKTDWVLVNASIAGSTTSTGLERLEFQLSRKTIEVLFLELGANDGLRGYSPIEMKKHLMDVINLAKKNHIKVILVGIDLPRNFSETYRKDFTQVFIDLSKHCDEFIPSIFSSLGGQEDYQEDYLHPNEQGHQKIADFLLPHIRKVI